MSKLNINVSGKLVGHLSVYAVTSEDKSYDPIVVINTDTSNFKKKFSGDIPYECKYKTIVISHNWIGVPKPVGGQIDVYTGGDIEFEAPLSAFIGSKKASKATLTYNGKKDSCKAGGWIRHTPKE